MHYALSDPMQKLYPACCSTPTLRAQTAPAQCFRAGRSRLSSTASLKQAVDFRRVPLYQQRSQCVLASAANKGRAPLFNREHEKKSLTDLLTSDPDSAAITVIVGSPSCGKTALTQHLVAERSQTSQQTGGSLQPIYIDCRRKGVLSPESFAAALLRATKSIGQQRQDVAVDLASALFRTVTDKIKLLGGDIDMKLKPIGDLIAQLKSTPDGTPLSIILDAFEQALADKATVSPAIIIDEANKFTSWSADHPKELDSLLSFFVAVTKQENLTHVLLLTSDYGYVSWLEQGIGKTFYNVQVIGDFPAKEAREFYNTRAPGPVSDEDWEQVYQVCGGNAGLLIRAAKADLQKALTDIIKTVRPSVRRGLKPSADAGWTAAQYAVAVKEIIDAPSHAVPALMLEDKFGSGYAGRQVLEAMVRENLLAYRPYSTWALDIDIDAFGPQQEEVVTAPTPAHLHCMRQLRLPDEPPADTSAGNASTDPEVAAVREAITRVEDTISSITTEIDGIKEDLTTAKTANDIEEVRYLRDKERQLRDEKSQLRQELLLLMQRQASAT